MKQIKGNFSLCEWIEGKINLPLLTVISECAIVHKISDCVWMFCVHSNKNITVRKWYPYGNKVHLWFTTLLYLRFLAYHQNLKSPDVELSHCNEYYHHKNVILCYAML